MYELNKYLDETPLKYYFSGNPYLWGHEYGDVDKYIELPGVDKKNCQVSFENESISIEAKDTQRDRDRNIEFYVGDIDVSTLNAELKDGLLHLTAKQKDQRKKIDIK